MSVESPSSIGRDATTVSVDDLSVVKQLADKHILITGVTGFVGKVLLTMIAAYSPKVRKVSVLIRANHQGDAATRFKAEVCPSEPFKAAERLIDARENQIDAAGRTLRQFGVTGGSDVLEVFSGAA